MTKLKVLLPVCELPDGATIVKRTGTFEYELIRKITFHHDGKKQDICATEGSAFIGTGAGGFNSISGNTEVLWVVSKETFYDWLTAQLR